MLGTFSEIAGSFLIDAHIYLEDCCGYAVQGHHGASYTLWLKLPNAGHRVVGPDQFCVVRSLR